MSTLTTEAPRMKAVASAAKLNVPRYGDLLRRFAPKVIETVEENRLALRILERLMSIGDGKRSAEENALLSLLAALVEQFEKKTYPAATSVEPKEILRDLMASNELKAADLADVMGGRSRVSEVLSGKRAISKDQAKRLGQRFGISPAAFI
ncbi:MAG TPA: helix-turn-helix domain-containing protein [Bryobacteraceae bacterium]|nr:helix-turn-helix domain-containing protein [Bryobacteraceae bacterium]